MRYSIKLTKIQCIKCYEFLVFARKISKSLSSEHTQKLLNRKKNWQQMHFVLQEKEQSKKQQIELGNLLVIK